MINNNNQNKLYNQNNNINQRRLFPQDRPKTNNNNTNLKYGQIPNPNQNNNNINRNNNHLNQNRSNVNKPNDELSTAFSIIQNELKKKDNRIMELKRKIRELTKKLESLTNNNNFSLSKNSPMATPFKEEPKNIYENNTNDNNLYNYEYINPNSNINQAKNNNIRSNSQSRAYQMNNLNYNSDTEKVIKKYQKYQGYDNLSHSNDNSVITYNGVNTNSKNEVKQYLKEVKAKIEPRKFREFISNIKLLTSKREIAPDREAIIENMRILFGKEHLDLFLRFEKIIGAGK